MEVQISTMKEDDLQALLPVWNKDFDNFWPFSILENEFKNSNSLCYVAKLNNEIVGIAGLWKSVDDIHITNIVIKKIFRNNGFGSSLLQKLINVSKDLKYTSITLEVNEKNIAAKKLYEKFNFKELGIRKKYYNNTDNAIIMTLYLN